MASWAQLSPSCLLPPQGSLLPLAPHSLCWACSGLWKSSDTTCCFPAAGTCQRVWAHRGLQLRQDHLTASLAGGLPAQLRPGTPEHPKEWPGLCLCAPATGHRGAGRAPLCLPGAQVLNSRGHFPCQDRESFFSSGPAAPLSATLGSQEAAGEARGAKAPPALPSGARSLPHPHHLTTGTGAHSHRRHVPGSRTLLSAEVPGRSARLGPGANLDCWAAGWDYW